MRGTLEGATYTFLDATLVPGCTYSYWLEELDTVGSITLHGATGWMTETAEAPTSPGQQEAPPVVPKASTLLLFGIAATGLASYLGLQIQTRRRK